MLAKRLQPRGCCAAKQRRITSTSVVSRQVQAKVQTTAMPIMDTATMVDRIKGALWGIFIADALSMPVHWYYNPNDILLHYPGGISKYEPPRARHPSSIMSLSSTGGHGRGDQKGRIIGDVINHGKHKFWGQPNVHYHQGMAAGENTLNALCARIVMRGMAANGGVYNPTRFLSDYVAFMTTPGTHNDTYAESFHRDFFVNWSKGVPPEKCSQGTEGHNTAQIGGFVMLPPVIMSGVAAGKNLADTQTLALQHLQLTHESRKLWKYAQMYVELFHNVTAGGQSLRAATKEMAGRMNIDLDKLVQPGFDDLRVVHRVFGSACYIEDSFPVMLYLAYKYADDFEKGVLANTNVGGENCHRGAALGALMGAALGESRMPPSLIQGLHDSTAIRKEIDAFVEALQVPTAQSAAAVKSEL